MTFLSKDIRDHLLGSANIMDAFADESGVRVYDSRLPQEVKLTEAIVINDLSNVPEMFLGGEVGRHTSIIQIDVWTDGREGKKRLNELAELVRNRLNGYRGQFGEGCSGTARMIRNDAVSAPPIDGGDKHRRRQSMDFEISHTADVPTFT